MGFGIRREVSEVFFAEHTDLLIPLNATSFPLSPNLFLFYLILFPSLYYDLC